MLQGNKVAEATTDDPLETSETHNFADGDPAAYMQGVEDLLKSSESAEVYEDSLVAMRFS
mgnify:CR=1 FL=1